MGAVNDGVRQGDGECRQPQSDDSAKVIAFAPGATTSRRHDRIERDEERGTILLFTGVRYERLEDERVRLTRAVWDEGQSEIA